MVSQDGRFDLVMTFEHSMHVEEAAKENIAYYFIVSVNVQRRVRRHILSPASVIGVRRSDELTP